METLTAFQDTCEKQLMEELNRFHIHLDSRSIIGHSESYVHMTAISGDLQVYIYTDEPEFIYQGAAYIFEVPDYPDEADRIRSFVGAVRSCLIGEDPLDSGTARVLLKKGGPI